MGDTIQDRLRFWRDDLSAPTDDVARDMLKEAADVIDRSEAKFEEYKRLSTEVIEQISGELAAKDKRIEELEKKQIWLDYHEGTTATLMPNKTINAAWECWKPLNPTKREALIFQSLGIVACQECGGTKWASKLSTRGEYCKSCNGRGWKIEGRSVGRWAMRLPEQRVGD